MQYEAIIDNQLVSIRKLRERNHWLFGKQWLVVFRDTIYSDYGEMYETETVKWISVKNIITNEPPIAQ